MKVQKEVWVEVCDYCNNGKSSTCLVCGNDMCSEHSINIQTGYGFSGYAHTISVCSIHLDERTRKLVEQQKKKMHCSNVNYMKW